MKKALSILSILLLFFTVLHSQEIFLQGRLINNLNQTPVVNAKIIRTDSLFDVSSDKSGYFKINIPNEGSVELIFSHPDYILQSKTYRPDQLKTPVLVKLSPAKSVRPDSLVLTYKNTLAIAPVELLFLGLTFEYERRITPLHALGSYATALLNQGLWMVSSSNSGVTLTGFKIEPFYRFYARTNLRDIGFVQLKLVYANFNINEHYYSDPTVVTPAQGFGIGIAWGWKFMHSRFPRHSIELTLGAKFVPFITADESMNDLIKNYRREYWWNVAGPGAVLDVKFTLGGIF